MAEAHQQVQKATNVPRLVSLFVAFLGCVVTAVPMAFHVGGNPAPLILIGSGVTVVALGLFLFFSI
jgi:protein-S-isoprenylcysteine O-methyltransferase Ste14